MENEKRPTEYAGLGQSGYTAGRRLPDPALERVLQARNSVFRERDGEESFAEELETDERWVGKGGVPPKP